MRIVCLLLMSVAIVRQTVHEIVLGSLTSDMAHQIGAARALLDGHGLAVPRLVGDSGPLLSSYTALSGWPPGLSVLMAGALELTGDPWHALALLDLTSVILFFGGWFVLLERLGPWISPACRGVFWLLWAFSWTPLHLMGSPGILSQGFYTTAIAAMLWAPSQHPAARGAAAGTLSSVAAWTRFAYVPLAGIPGIAAYLASLGHRVAQGTKTRLRSAARGQLATAVLLAGGVLLYQRATSGQATYLSQRYDLVSSGWHWENLLRLCPFPLHLLGIPQFSGQLFAGNPDQGTGPWILGGGLSIVILGLAVAPLWKRWRASQTRLSSADPAAVRVFLLVAALSSTATLATLAVLSLRVPLNAYAWAADGFWTYVEEPRYFAGFFAFLAVGWACAIGDRLCPARSELAQTSTRGVGALLLIATLGIGTLSANGNLVRELRHGFDGQAPWSVRRQDDRTLYRVVRGLLRERKQVFVLQEDPTDQIAAYLHNPSVAGAWRTALMAAATPLPATRAQSTDLECANCAIVIVLDQDAPGARTPAAARLAGKGGFRELARMRGAAILVRES